MASYTCWVFLHHMQKKKWSRLMGSEGSTLPCLVNLELRGLPVHVWECSSVENC